MKYEDYLKRIGYLGPLANDKATLFRLHECHVFSIPFEGLDIHTNRAIRLDLESIYKKVIKEKRGGYCYELNHLFYQLLSSLGFDCDMLSSRIYNEHGDLGPEYDHMSIIVRLKEDYLVDVGYGDLFIKPIRIGQESVSQDWFKFYKISHLRTSHYLLSESKDGNQYRPRYQFDITPKKIEDFGPQNHYKQYHPDSYFVQNRICTKPIKEGRITILNNKLIKKSNGIRSESPIQSEGHFCQMLKGHFGIIL